VAVDRSEAEQTWGESGPELAQFSVPVDDLLPEVRKKNGLERADNLEHVLPNLLKAVEERPWLRQFLDGVRSGEKRAIFRLVVGGLIVTAAASAAYELGPAHGKDLRELAHRLQRHKQQSEAEQPDDGLH